MPNMNQNTITTNQTNKQQPQINVNPEISIEYSAIKAKDIMPDIISILSKSSQSPSSRSPNSTPELHEPFTFTPEPVLKCDLPSSYHFIAKYLNIPNHCYPLLDNMSPKEQKNLKPEPSLRSLLKKKTSPKEVQGFLNDSVLEECVNKFVDCYITCVNCQSTNGVIYSRIMDNGEYRAPFKKCQDCGHWSWLESKTEQTDLVIEDNDDDKESVKSSTISIRSYEKTEREEEIDRILELVLLQKEIRGFLVASDCELIIDFLQRELENSTLLNCIEGRKLGNERKRDQTMFIIGFWLKKFKHKDLDLRKYKNYMMFHTILKGLKNPMTMIKEACFVLRKLFSEELDEQIELLCLIQELLLLKPKDRELNDKEIQTIFSYFYSENALELDFLMAWKNNEFVHNERFIELREDYHFLDLGCNTLMKKKVKAFLEYVQKEKESEDSEDEEESDDEDDDTQSSDEEDEDVE